MIFYPNQVEQCLVRIVPALHVAFEVAGYIDDLVVVSNTTTAKRRETRRPTSTATGLPFNNVHSLTSWSNSGKIEFPNCSAEIMKRTSFGRRTRTRDTRSANSQAQLASLFTKKLNEQIRERNATQKRFNVGNPPLFSTVEEVETLRSHSYCC